MKTVAYIRASGIYNDSRATKEITDLANAGFHLVVLGWDRDGKAAQECNSIFSDQKGIVFHFFNLHAPNGIGLKGIDKLLRWFVWIYKRLKNEKQLDAVHACDLDTGLITYAFCKRHKIPLVYDIYDYYIDCHSVPHSIQTIIENAEIRVINHSQVTIICTEERIEQISKASPKKVIVIHNSPDVPSLPETGNIYDFAYCGTLIDERLINNIFKHYPANDDLKFCFAGYGKNENQAINISKQCDNFTFLGIIPYGQVLEVESKSICLSAIYDPSYRNHRLCAPNKFYEAMALGKPIIVCKGTGIDRIVESKKIGVVINYNASEFYDAVRYLIGNPEACKEMGENGRNLYESEYRWEVMKGRLLEAYNAVFQ